MSSSSVLKNILIFLGRLIYQTVAKGVVILCKMYCLIHAQDSFKTFNFRLTYVDKSSSLILKLIFRYCYKLVYLLKRVIGGQA